MSSDIRRSGDAPVKTVMLMVDGFGVPEEGWRGSVFERYCVPGFVEIFEEFSIPVDPGMGVPGIPQSATGQTALFTGENAASLMGAHLQGFPGPALRDLIARRNIFSRLAAKGLSATFANAYVRYTVEELAGMRMRSVTTVMAESALGAVRGADDLRGGRAVYHDLTRRSVADAGIDPITPEKAAEHLLAVAEEYDFTLFEYFLTDRAGHKGDPAFLAEALRELSGFLMALMEMAGDDFAIVLTSDHGNCEKPDTKGHTRNPVPFLLIGADPAAPPAKTPVPREEVIRMLPVEMD